LSDYFCKGVTLATISHLAISERRKRGGEEKKEGGYFWGGRERGKFCCSISAYSKGVDGEKERGKKRGEERGGKNNRKRGRRGHPRYFCCSCQREGKRGRETKRKKRKGGGAQRVWFFDMIIFTTFETLADKAKKGEEKEEGKKFKERGRREDSLLSLHFSQLLAFYLAGGKGESKKGKKKRGSF